MESTRIGFAWFLFSCVSDLFQDVFNTLGVKKEEIDENVGSEKKENSKEFVRGKRACPQ